MTQTKQPPIQLQTIKLALFDFDDTLAKHADNQYVEHRKLLGEDKYFKQAYLNPDRFYTEIEPCTASLEMQSFLAYLRTLNVKLYCVSGMRHTLHLKAKQTFLHAHYGNDIELIAAGTQAGKVDVTRVLQDIHNCRPNEVLFVDDKPFVTVAMQEHGYNAILADAVPTLAPDGKSFTAMMDD